MVRDLTVYTGTAWYQNCDPCLRVVYGPTLPLESADKAFRRAMREYERDANAGQEQERCECGRFVAFPSLYWAGRVYPESLRKVLSGMTRKQRHEFLADLRASGEACPEY